jgi:hypothetical protein
MMRISLSAIHNWTLKNRIPEAFSFPMLWDIGSRLFNVSHVLPIYGHLLCRICRKLRQGDILASRHSQEVCIVVCAIDILVGSYCSFLLSSIDKLVKCRCIE